MNKNMCPETFFTENIEKAEFSNSTECYANRNDESRFFISNQITVGEQEIDICFEYFPKKDTGHLDFIFTHPRFEIGPHGNDFSYLDDGSEEVNILLWAIIERFGQQMFDPKNYEECDLPSGCLEKYESEFYDYCDYQMTKPATVC